MHGNETKRSKHPPPFTAVVTKHGLSPSRSMIYLYDLPNVPGVGNRGDVCGKRKEALLTALRF